MCMITTTGLTWSVGRLLFLILAGIAWGVLLSGCSSLRGRSLAPSPPIKVVVGPVFLEAPVTKSTQIYTFKDAPLPENESAIRAQLIEEVQIKAQQFLTEHLSRQTGFLVVPFDETRRLLADLAVPTAPLNETQIHRLAVLTGADVVLSGLIHDYGKVRWQYWVTGWVLHATAWTAAIGLATAWNPTAIGAFLAFDATTDLPIWYGGAYVFGWAFRPVRIHLVAVQQRDCEGLIWTQEELVIKVPGKMLEEYPPEKRERKEIQLEANLNRAMEEIAEAAGRSSDSNPAKPTGPLPKLEGSPSFPSWIIYIEGRQVSPN